MLAVAKPTKKPEPEVKDERSGRKTAPIQVEKELARWAAVVASYDQITQAELVSDHLRPFLKAHFERVQAAMRRELDSQ